MSRQERMPGDPAIGDPTYGPLNGLFDDLHHDARSRERERDLGDARRLHRPDGLRPPRRAPIERIRALIVRALSRHGH